MEGCKLSKVDLHCPRCTEIHVELKVELSCALGLYGACLNTSKLYADSIAETFPCALCQTPFTGYRTHPTDPGLQSEIFDRIRLPIRMYKFHSFSQTRYCRDCCCQLVCPKCFTEKHHTREEHVKTSGKLSEGTADMDTQMKKHIIAIDVLLPISEWQEQSASLKATSAGNTEIHDQLEKKILKETVVDMQDKLTERLDLNNQKSTGCVRGKSNLFVETRKLKGSSGKGLDKKSNEALFEASIAIEEKHDFRLTIPQLLGADLVLGVALLKPSASCAPDEIYFNSDVFHTFQPQCRGNVIQGYGLHLIKLTVTLCYAFIVLYLLLASYERHHGCYDVRHEFSHGFVRGFKKCSWVMIESVSKELIYQLAHQFGIILPI